jgi:hypothetical protein
MSASLDGYYIDNPYHWGGGFSIFDPRMVQSAQLSHGVFSVRYGHTISGLLEVASKKPSSAETEFEASVNTSAANFNLSLPFGRGGVMFMGRVTYYDPVVWAAKQLSKSVPELAVINSVRVAPYIRSGAINLNYRFFDNLDLQSTAFWGMDGVGASYNNAYGEGGLSGRTDMSFDWTNYQGFITAGLSWNPRGDMLLKTTLGTGYHQAKVDGGFSYNFSRSFSGEFNDKYSGFLNTAERYRFNSETSFKEDSATINAQGRADYDWQIAEGLLAAAGVQEMFSNVIDTGNYKLPIETPFDRLSDKDKATVIEKLGPSFLLPYNQLIVNYLSSYSTNVNNKLFTTSAYTLAEYNTPDNRFSAELGLRLDHFYLYGDGFSVSTKPVLNPRLNMDFNVFKDRGIFQSLDLSAGTGLFSSINSMISMAEERYDLSEAKPSRSWTTVMGSKLEFGDGLFRGLSFNAEWYYKYIFDRAYIPLEMGMDGLTPKPHLDGKGRVWGVDLMLQKAQSRYWDGWITYSYNWARYLDPQGGNSGSGISGGNQGDDWYFPSYHRFHNLNLILNIKPVPRINIYTRFGFASGTQLSKVAGPITSYPVYVLDQNIFIEKFRRAMVRDENNRTTPSFPLDLKLSILGNNENGKARYEVYVALENALALLYTAQGNTSFNSYTGQEDTGSNSASYELPIPIPSFGFKLSY